MIFPDQTVRIVIATKPPIAQGKRQGDLQLVGRQADITQLGIGHAAIAATDLAAAYCLVPQRYRIGQGLKLRDQDGPGILGQHDGTFWLGFDVTNLATIAPSAASAVKEPRRYGFRTSRLTQRYIKLSEKERCHADKALWIDLRPVLGL